ncbi:MULTISPECIES: gamma-glutamyl-gamma-aminobutyrate hydrolase family protein [unclassified Streptomyces]|uniref:gamma-glutamyl-gamma-aminobutyrate hydrolase family protein n=1 Tax=unclassified Streptomyces TaxID=2593676 RepID=UPI0033D5C83F
MTNFDSAPLIGLTGRRGAGHMLGFPEPFFDTALDIYVSDYARSVLTAGGVPVHLPMDAPPSRLVKSLDGILISGGEDVDPRLYGEVAGAKTSRIDRTRDTFESELIHEALKHGVPVLGICRGSQLINVVLGGSLVADLPAGEGESHGLASYYRTDRVHRVSFEPGTVAHTLYGPETVVNSFHHQAVARPGEGVTVTGRADDGVVEAIEAAEGRFLGVQWHPEVFGGDPAFDWLVAAALDSHRLSDERIEARVVPRPELLGDVSQPTVADRNPERYLDRI